MIRIDRRPVALAAGLVLVCALSAATFVRAATLRFYPDDPIQREPESQDASRAEFIDLGLFYDLTKGLFATPRLDRSNVHAQNVNTIDEVPDSSWFTNRILPRRLSSDEIVRGPNVDIPPNPERWTFVREKSAGYAPGFTARDANGTTWFLSFDPPANHEGATGAMVVASKIFWALGYNQVETFITSVDPARLAIDPDATIKRPSGERTPATQADIDEVFERAARNPDGTYRAAAGRLLPGKVLGPFRYEGKRPDDPNDVVDHQHRRELRALRVFGAWTNLTDLKAGNTLDTLVEVNGRSVIRHYLQDVGSTFGMGANGPHDWDEGFEYFIDNGPSNRRLVTFGLALSPWQTTPYTIYPSLGRFEAEAFDPLTWKPHAPTTAYMEMMPDDAFWAARRVGGFDNDMIRAIVHTGQYSDAAAEQHLAALLMERRDKILRAYLPAVNPIVDGRLSETGDLTFQNAAVAAGAADAPSGYTAQWAEYDNRTGQSRAIGETRGTGTSIQAPSGIPAAPGAIVRVDVSADASAPKAWQVPVHLYFRRAANGWTLVGLERDATQAGLPLSEVPVRTK